MNPITTSIYTLSGNITISLGARPEKLEQEILCSLLYCQLVVQRRGNTPETTWPHYVDYLSNLGWSLKTREASRLEFNKSNLWSILQGALDDAGSGAEKAALNNAADELQSLPTDSPAGRAIINRLNLNILNAGAAPQPTKATTLVLNVIWQNDAVTTVQISFETPDMFELAEFRQWKISSIDDDNNNIRVLTANLSADRDKSNRDTIITKLGKKIETELFNVRKVVLED